MITATNKKVIVRADLNQKATFILNGIEVTSALLFETNFREKSPVIAQVVSGNEVLNKGDIILCHHNTFYEPSPYYLYDDLFSIPTSGSLIFCKLDDNGCLLPIYGNMMCSKMDVETELYLPISQREQYSDRVIIEDAGYCNYKKGDLLFTRPYAAYQIVYNWEGNQNRVYKVPEEQICGILK